MLTDFDVHPLPSTPLTLPPAGESFVDPVFGTEITVFYAGTLQDNPNAYYGAGWKYGCITADNLFLLASMLYPIDPKTLAPGKPVPLPSISPRACCVRVSPSRPLLYIVDLNGKLYEWNYLALRLDYIFDFTPYLPPGATGYQGWNIEGIAGDDSVILLIDIASPSRIIAFDRLKGKVVWQRDPVHPFANYLKPVIDKTGDWIGPFENNLLFCPMANIRTGVETVYCGLAPEALAQHNVHLHAASLQTNGVPEAPNRGNITLVDFLEPPRYQTPLLLDNSLPGEGTYICVCNDERWGFAGGFPDPPVKWQSLTNVGQGEIFAFKTDGSTRAKAAASIKRYCHTRASAGWNDPYWNRVHPGVSSDGSLCVYMTNNLNPNPTDPKQTIWVMIFRTGLSAPSYVPRDPVLAKSDVRTPWLYSDAWAQPGPRGPIGTQYAGLPKSDGSGWTAECGLPISFAASSPAGAPPLTITPDGRYTVPPVTQPTVYHISARVGDLVSDPKSGLVVIGFDPKKIPPGAIPDQVTPPDTGVVFPKSGLVPPQTVLNPTGIVVPPPPPAPAPSPTPPPPNHGPVSVTITSNKPSVHNGIAECVSGETIQFSADVPVIWSLAALAGGTNGTISVGTGLYTSPAGLTKPATAQVVATGPNGVKGAMNIVIDAAPTPPIPTPPQPNPPPPPNPPVTALFTDAEITALKKLAALIAP